LRKHCDEIVKLFPKRNLPAAANRSLRDWDFVDSEAKEA